MRRIGIISGVERELALFLPDAPREEKGCRVARVDHGGKQLFLACNGIGKVAAATAAATLHARFDVELLLVIGTAGKIGDLPGDLFNIIEAVQADFGAQRAEGLVMHGTHVEGHARHHRRSIEIASVAYSFTAGGDVGTFGLGVFHKG